MGSHPVLPSKAGRAALLAALLLPLLLPLRGAVAAGSGGVDGGWDCTACPAIHEPACGGGVTFSHACLAACQGVVDVTAGACEGGLCCGALCATTPHGMQCVHNSNTPVVGWVHRGGGGRGREPYPWAAL